MAGNYLRNLHQVVILDRHLEGITYHITQLKIPSLITPFSAPLLTSQFNFILLQIQLLELLEL